MTHSTTRKLTVLAMICAIAFILAAFIRVPVVLFLRYDPKDVVIAIGGFLYGPMAALLVATVVSAVQMFTVSATGPIGLVMNIISSAAFCCTAAFVYKKKRTMAGAVAGLVLAIIFTTIVMLLWNYLITPLFMNIPRQQVIALLIPAFLPFNLISHTLNAAITLLLYKPVRSALAASGMLPDTQESSEKGKKKVGVILGSGFAILTCVLWIMVLRGYL